MTVGERTLSARDHLRAYLTEHPKASKIEAQRWLNNYRVAGRRLTLPFSELNRVFLEMRAAQAFNPPRLVVSKPANPPPVIIPPPPPPEPPKPVPMEVAAPGTLETTTKFFTPGRPERQRFVEDLALDNPRKGQAWIQAECRKKFGIGIDSQVIQNALEQSRVLAGMKAKLSNRGPFKAPPAEASPKTKEPDPMPLPDPPPPPLKPDAMLREAAGVLKLLVEKMGWQQLALTVDHKGEITYDAIPLPVLPAKGSLRL